MIFELDFRNIMVLLSLSIHAGLLWILFRYGRKTAGGRAYAMAILAIAGWIAPMALYRAHLFGEVVVWARLLYVMATLTSVTFFYFTLVFPDKKKVSHWIPALLLLEVIAVIALTVHPNAVIESVTSRVGGEDIINFGQYYFIYTLHISGFFFAGFVVLFKKWLKAKGILRKQIVSILGGYFLASNLAMATNLILPWLGYFELNWMGQFFSTLVAVFTTYAIFRHRLMDIRILATEGFLVILNFFLFLQIILSRTPQELLVNGVITFAVLIVSFSLVLNMQHELKRKEELADLAKSLEKANMRLKELDRQKTEFLSIASHQLRTPLSIIKGYIELIEDGAYGKPTKKMLKVLVDMDDSNERLVKLVDEFLNISRIEQGRTKYRFSKTDITPIIMSVIEELKSKAEKKGLEISCDDTKTMTAYIDEEKIRHIIFNYIDNAIKYSDEGTISVDITSQKDGVAVRVTDHGFGFNKEDEANFFNKFYRGKNVEGTNVNGTGLGIYVCRQFVEAHGGYVWAKSDGLGKGSEFGFWVPAHETAAHKASEKAGEKVKQTVVNQYSVAQAVASSR